MTFTADHLFPEQGKIRRTSAVVIAWLQALDYTSFDYTEDRINLLERQVAALTEELRASRASSSADRAPR